MPGEADTRKAPAIVAYLADFLHATGDDEGAMSHLKQAVALFAEIGGNAGALQPEIWTLVAW